MCVVGVDVLEVSLDPVDAVLVQLVASKFFDGFFELLDLNREYVERVDFLGTAHCCAHTCEL